MLLEALYIFSAGDENEFGGYHVQGLRAMFMPVLWLLYFPVCESIFGQTIGKKAFDLRLTDLNGNTPSIAHTFLRRVLDFFEIMFFGIPAVLVINHSEKNQRIGDMMASTTVVRTDGVCRFCGAELELTTKEVMNDSFKCPKCNELN